MGIRHPNDPWISTTRSFDWATWFATHGGTISPPNPIVAIDLPKVSSPVLDVSTHSAASAALRHSRAINFAADKQEVLINHFIDPEAIIMAF